MTPLVWLLIGLAIFVFTMTVFHWGRHSFHMAHLDECTMVDLIKRERSRLRLPFGVTITPGDNHSVTIRTSIVDMIIITEFHFRHFSRKQILLREFRCKLVQHFINVYNKSMEKSSQYKVMEVTEFFLPAFKHKTKNGC